MTFGNASKGTLKKAVKLAAATLGHVLPRHEAASRILTYHSVGTRDHDMNVSPEAFEQQMAWLAENQLARPLSDAVEGKPGVAVTFDDGYRDNLIEAAPILDRYRIPATFFVVPGRVGAFLDHDRPTADARLMSWADIHQLEKRGFDIGAHTLSHRRLATLDRAEQVHEIIEGGRLLEKNLGHRVLSFAYPFGSALDYSAVSVELVRQAGYDYALSNRYGRCNAEKERWELRRIWIDRTDSFVMFQAKVNGALDTLAFLDSGWGIRTRRGLNTLLRIR